MPLRRAVERPTHCVGFPAPVRPGGDTGMAHRVAAVADLELADLRRACTTGHAAQEAARGPGNQLCLVEATRMEAPVSKWRGFTGNPVVSTSPQLASGAVETDRYTDAGDRRRPEDRRDDPAVRRGPAYAGVTRVAGRRWVSR